MQDILKKSTIWKRFIFLFDMVDYRNSVLIDMEGLEFAFWIFAKHLNVEVVVSVIGMHVQMMVKYYYDNFFIFSMYYLVTFFLSCHNLGICRILANTSTQCQALGMDDPTYLN